MNVRDMKLVPCRLNVFLVQIRNGRFLILIHLLVVVIHYLLSLKGMPEFEQG